jgi:hypothetical protein
VSAQILAVVVDCRDPRRQAAFWATVLSYEMTERNKGEFKVSDPDGQRGSLYFMRVPESRVVKNRLHPDLATDGGMELEVARLTERGARVIDIRHDPDVLKYPDMWTVMQDPGSARRGLRGRSLSRSDRTVAL